MSRIFFVSYAKFKNLAERNPLVILQKLKPAFKPMEFDDFLHDFNVDILSELLCQGQPDSPDELQVRKYIALTDYFWKKSNF